MRRCLLYTILLIVTASCAEYTPENEKAISDTIPVVDEVIDISIDHVHEVYLKQKLDDIWSLQFIEQDYPKFDIQEKTNREQIELKDSIKEVKIIEYLTPFIKDTFRLKTEITYYNIEKDTLIALLSSKEIKIDQEVTQVVKVLFKK